MVLKYLGIAVFIKKRRRNRKKLGVLKYALDIPFGRIAKKIRVKKYKDIMESKEFYFLQDNIIYHVDIKDLPENTPEGYEKANVSYIPYCSMFDLIKIYIPLVGHKWSTLNKFSTSLYIILQKLYGEDLIQYIVKRNYQDKDFDEGKEKRFILGF